MNSPLSALRRRVVVVALAAAFAATLTVTTTAPAEARGLNLHRGSHGAKVRLLEVRLDRLNLLPPSAVDGRYRQATVNAVKRFQRNRHLRPTGRVNYRVWNLVARAARAKAAAKPAPSPAPKPAPAPPPTGTPPAIVGHRGVVGPEAPENTLAAMRAAASSATVLEFDLRVTADHQIVLIHDGTLDRTTNCSGRVIDWTLQNLKAKCRAGTQPIPTFEELAAYAATTSLKIAPEIKNNEITDADLGQVLDTIDEHGLAGRTIMQSFTPDVLTRVHASRPSMRLMLLATRPMPVSAASDVGATTVAVRLEYLTASDVSLYKKNGLTVWTFTAIDEPTLDLAYRIRVDAVITDIPRQARSHYGT